MPKVDPSRRPPQLGALLERPEVAAWIPRISRPLVVREAASCLEAARSAYLERGAERSAGLAGAEGKKAGEAPVADDLALRVAEACAAVARRRIQPVLNATGVLLHTNLGRSPLEAAAWNAVAAANTGYCSLEFDLQDGGRGRRGGLARELAATLAAAEDALVLNNNAAAVLLALSALAAGREVLVSRGEQLQIGGGFRIPDILALSGARLVEVGTTNVTTVEDFRAALGPDTAAILVVHRANFTMRGFVSSPSLAELAAILPEGVRLLVDQGSGCSRSGLPGEVALRNLIRDGAGLVCFSGDKLLGGPQAGFAAGKADLVRAMSAHPLARALRPGKTVLSLVEESLIRVLNGEDLVRVPELPVLRNLGDKVMALLPEVAFRIVPSTCALGGGSTPDEGFPSLALELEAKALAAIGGPEAFLGRLRRAEPPLVAIVREGRVLLDLSGLAGADPLLLASLLSSALRHDEA